MSALTIGLVAYALDPSKVFVRVPNERGRWMLVDRSVVEVACPYCEAIVGEPCHAVRTSWRSLGKPHDPIRYHTGIHVDRRRAWQESTGLRYPARRAKPHKLHIRAAELGELQRPPPGIDKELVPITPNEIALLKLREPFFGLFVQGEAERNGGLHVCRQTREHVEQALSNIDVPVTPKEFP